MTASLASLLAPFTADQVQQRIRSGLHDAGLPTSDWAPAAEGGLENGLLEVVATTLAELGAAPLADAIAGGFLGRGTGVWLTFLAKRFYLVDRNLASSTVQAITLTCAVDAGPYDVAEGDLVVAGAGTIEGANRYRSMDAATIPSGAGIAPGVPAVVMPFQAENPGAAYADPPDTITTLVTSLAGVTARNARILTPSPAALLAGGASRGQVIPIRTTTPTRPDDRFRVRITASGQLTGAVAQFQVSTDDGQTWEGPYSVSSLFPIVGRGCSVRFVQSPTASPSFIVGDVFFWASTCILQQGSDAETDAQLGARGRERWLTLSDVPGPGTIEMWAKLAAPEVTRVRVGHDPNAANGGRVVISSSAGRASPATVVAVQNYIAARIDPGEVVNVVSVATRPVAPSGSVLVPRSRLLEVATQADRNWTAYLESVAIGGVVRLAELQQAVMDAGALDYDSLQLAGGPNVVLGADEVAVLPDGSTLVTALAWEPV